MLNSLMILCTFLAADNAVSRPSESRLQQFVYPLLVRQMCQPVKSGMLDTNRDDPNGSPFEHVGLMGSIRWINKIIHPDWLPSDASILRKDTLLIRDEYTVETSNNPILLSATHVGWDKNGWGIRVSQTFKLMTIEMVPSVVVEPAKTTQDKREYAHNIITIFNDKYVYNDANSIEGDLRDEIYERSFVSGFAVSVDGGIASTPWNKDLARIVKRVASSGEPTTIHEPKLRNAELFVPTEDPQVFTKQLVPKTWRSHWWEYVGWWTDGSKVIFWIEKREADAKFNPWAKWF